MNSNLTVYNDVIPGHGLRIDTSNPDKPMFVARDVALTLGYKNTRDAIKKHCRHQNTVAIRDGNRGNPMLTMIPEGDVYRLIIRSKLPSAQQFEREVFDVILPSIRKHGMYATPATVETMLADPDTMIQTLTALKEERELRQAAETKAIELDAENTALSKDNLEMQPKALVYDARIANKNETVATIARTLTGVNTQRTKGDLLREGFLYRQEGRTYRVYSRYREKLFAEKQNRKHGYWEIIVLPKGKEKLVELYRAGKLTMKKGFEEAWMNREAA